MVATIAISVLCTSLLSALLTWALAYWFFQRQISGRFEARLQQIQDEFEARVKRGVLAAGEELMPDLREQVSLGFQDALRGSETGEMVESYAGAVNRGADLISSRIETLFGFKPKKK